MAPTTLLELEEYTIELDAETVVVGVMISVMVTVTGPGLVEAVTGDTTAELVLKPLVEVTETMYGVREGDTEAVMAPTTLLELEATTGAEEVENEIISVIVTVVGAVVVVLTALLA